MYQITPEWPRTRNNERYPVNTKYKPQAQMFDRLLYNQAATFYLIYLLFYFWDTRLAKITKKKKRTGSPWTLRAQQ